MSQTATQRVQRSCGCGGACGGCKRDERLQRSTRGAQQAQGEAPPIVHEVLRSPGEPLEAATRTSMESRFGHDFSRVRVHRDEHAARSAEAVSANAYTVGSHVVFGANRYAPATDTGTRLLAHELTHTIQQRSMNEGAGLMIGAPHDPLERAADRAADAIGSGEALSPLSGAAATVVQRDKGGKPQAAGDKTGATAAIQHAGSKVLDPVETGIMAAEVARAGVGTEADGLVVPESTNFVLHDSAGASSLKTLKDNATKNRGPLGGGIGAYVPRDAPAVIGRKSFFETHRPTTTETEKGLDYFKEKGDANLAWNTWKNRRDDHFRKIWSLTRDDVANKAISKVLSSYELTDAETAKERQGGWDGDVFKEPLVDQLTGKASEKKPADKKAVTPPATMSEAAKTEPVKAEAAKPGGAKTPEEQKKADAAKKPAKKAKPVIYTTASWVIEKICDLVVTDNKGSATGIATEGHEKELEKECNSVAGFFRHRNELLQKSVSIEIVQPGVNEGLIEADEKRKKNTAAAGEKAAEEAKKAAQAKSAKVKSPAEVKAPAASDKTAPPTDAKEATAAKEDPKVVAERKAFEERSKYKHGVKDTCNLGNPYILPFASEPYSVSQYKNVLGLYFRAALGAGYYPRISTHYETDGGAGHCDPRCFNLTRLYTDIAVSLGHAKGSTYGITPKYGIGGGANVWWDDDFCHGEKPS